MSRLQAVPDQNSPFFKGWLENLSRQLIVESLFYDLTDAENSGTGETDLVTHVLRAGILTGVGDSLKIVAAGNMAATVNNKRVKLKFGGTTIYDTGSVAITTASSWTIESRIIRVESAVAKVYTTFISSSAVLPVITSVIGITEDLTVKNTIALTGQGGATSDVTLSFWKGFLEP